MILLDEPSYDRLVREAKDERPEEACGVLAGTIGKGQDLDVVGDEKVAGVREIDYPPPDAAVRDNVKVVERVFTCRNVADEPQWRYTIDPADQLEAFRTVDEEEMDLIGFYHSHPRGPRQPSETDVDEATWTGYSYVIVSLDGADPWVGAWVYDEEDGFTEERVVIQ